MTDILHSKHATKWQYFIRRESMATLKLEIQFRKLNESVQITETTILFLLSKQSIDLKEMERTYIFKEAIKK
jgi:hypothetical protein